MEILMIVLNYLLPVIAAVVAMLLAAGAKKLLDKWGVERSDKIDAMIDKYVGIGVNTAEVAARKYMALNGGTKMAGASKKVKAIKVVMDELEQSGITGVAQELISSRIESYLEEKGHNPTVK